MLPPQLNSLSGSLMNLTAAYISPYIGQEIVWKNISESLGAQSNFWYSFSADAAQYHALSLPLTTQEIIGVTLISLMNMLANAGGIGGGGIMIPFMMIFFNLPIAECIPLANSFALISSITRFVINYN